MTADELAEVLRDVVRSAMHPRIARRVSMLDLAPIRAALSRHSGPDEALGVTGMGEPLAHAAAAD